MVFAVEVRDVWSPKLFGLGTLLLDPVGNLVKHIAAEFPDVQVLRTTDGKFSLADWAVGGAEQVPGVAILGDGRIVRVLDVTFDLHYLWNIFLLVVRMGKRRCQKANAENEDGFVSHCVDLSPEQGAGTFRRCTISEIVYCRLGSGVDARTVCTRSPSC